MLVGSLLAESGTNFLPGGEVETSEGPRRYLVVEACEYRRAFLELAPSMIVITNIEEDHLDYYKDLADIERAFLELTEKLREGGTCVTTQDVRNRVFHPNLGTSDVPRFGWVDYGEISDDGLRLRIPGRHNVENAKAVLAAAGALGVSRESALAALNDFHGTWRRFEYQGRIGGSGASVYDDYAHHPSEIRATLQGAREARDKKYTIYRINGHGKLWAVFQPHLFSRTRQLLDGFARSFVDADEVLIVDIYAAREQDDAAIHSRDLTAAAQKYHPRVRYGGSLAQAAEILKKETTPEDTVVLMGAGDIGGVSQMLRVR